MIKPSEFAPRSSALMQQLIARAFDETEVTVITGGSDVGEEFSALPFDHLISSGVFLWEPLQWRWVVEATWLSPMNRLLRKKKKGP